MDISGLKNKLADISSLADECLSFECPPVLPPVPCEFDDVDERDTQIVHTLASPVDLYAMTMDSPARGMSILARELIEGTRENDSVRMLSYELTSSQVSHAIIDAHNRGVDCRVVVSDDKPVYYGIDTTLGYKFTHKKSGRGSKIMHTKMWLFSSTYIGGVRVKNVVCIGSGNLRDYTSSRGEEVLVFQDAALYSELLGHFRDVEKHAKNDTDDPTYKIAKGGVAGLRVYELPERRDIHLGQIRALNPANGPTSLDIIMAFWSDSELRLVDEINKQVDDGADIRVICRDVLSGSTGSATWNALKTCKAPVKYYPQANSQFIHNKSFRISGGWGSSSEYNALYTGSVNYTYSATKLNDELMVRTTDDTVINKHKAYFNELWNHPDIRTL